MAWTLPKFSVKLENRRIPPIILLGFGVTMLVVALIIATILFFELTANHFGFFTAFVASCIGFYILYEIFVIIGILLFQFFIKIYDILS